MTPLLLAFIFAAIVLYRGPLAFGPLTDLLEHELDAAVPQLGVEIGAAVLSWNRDLLRLEVQVLDARLLDRSGAQLAAFSRASLDFNGEDLLLGRLVPEEVIFWRPSIDLYRDRDGVLFLKAQEQDRRWPLDSVISGLADATESAGSTILQPSATRTIRLTALQSQLSVEDVGLGIKATATDANVAVDYRGGETNLSFASVMNVHDEVVSVGLGVARRPGDGGYSASVRFEGLRASALPKIISVEQLGKLSGFDVDVEGQADFFLAEDGSIPTLDLDLAFGPGTVALADYFPAPLELKSALLRCRFDNNLQRLLLSNVDAEFSDGLHIFFAGELSGLTGELSIAGAGGLENLPAERITRYWPFGLGQGPRKWVAENIHGGIIDKAELSIDIKAGELDGPRLRDDAVEFSWRFREVEAAYLEGMPKLTRGVGDGLVTGQRFELNVKKAVSDNIVVTKGRLLVPDFYVDTSELFIEFDAEGAVENALALIDREPLDLLSDFHITPRDSHGAAWVSTKLVLPLSDNLTLDDVRVETSAQLQDFASDQRFGGYLLTGGTLSIKADNKAFSLFGTASINGVPSEIAWSRSFVETAAQAGDRLKLRTRMDDKARTALGLDPGEGLRGAVRAEADLVLLDDGAVNGNVRADLAAAELRIDEIAWTKRAGQPANVDVDFRHIPGKGTEVTRLAMRTADLEFFGSGALDKDKNLLHLEGQRLAFGLNDLKFRLSWLPDDTKTLLIEAGQLDLRDFLSASVGVEEPEAEDLEALDIDLSAGRMLVTDDIRLTEVRATGKRREGIWSRFNLRAEINQGPAFRMFLKPSGDNRKFLLFAQDAGAIARVLDFSNGILGGQIRVDAQLPLSQGWRNGIQGTLRAADFKVVNAPTLAQLLTLGSFTGISDSLEGKGIAFSRLELPFTLQGPELKITGARAIGPALGLTADIEFDRGSEQIEAAGTIIPAYSINSVLGKIPIIGNILVGRPGEGLFAMNYTARGNFAEPEITINPLTALAPGFIRNIVTGIEEPIEPIYEERPDN
jgi:hypothetical protein